jgi:hypothetical protein
MAKLPFEMEQSAKLPVDQRGAIALEHIAHYLDRIEGHLKKLANAPEESSSATNIRDFPRRR